MNKDYEIVTLGYNCEPRLYLTQWELIPTKIKGRLSFPFDLAIHSLSIVNDQLINNFQNYLEKIRYGYKINKKYYWTNFYDYTVYYHDFSNKPHLHKKILKRYKKRIENFKNVLKNEKYIFFVLNCEPENISAEDINVLYENLLNIRKLPFRLLIWNRFENIDVKILNPAIKVFTEKTPKIKIAETLKNSKENEVIENEHKQHLKDFVIKTIKEEGFNIKIYKKSLQDKIKNFFKYNFHNIFSVTNSLENYKIIIFFGKKFKLFKIK